MDFINLKDTIFDNNLIIAIIAINMTIIGLTSLAETKRIIGVDYGKFLVKKYRILSRFRIYELLIIFAIVNVTSLFLMFVQYFEFRVVNFILLMVSLMFAIYYFFAYIISENKLVKKQIYEDELLGLYYKSNDYNHQEADVLTEMSGGSRTSKKLSTNVISYFNTYNSESQRAFEEIFGSSSLLYNYSKKTKKILKHEFNISPYEYRSNSNGINDISYEYFQLFRHCEQQDKWSIEILRIFDGERLINENYEIFRLYNFARVITHLNLFGHNDALYKYKFLEYIIQYYYAAILIANEDSIDWQTSEKVDEVERYTFNQLVTFMFNNENKQRGSTFKQKSRIIIGEIISTDKYKGILGEHELILLFLNKTLEIDTQFMKDIFTELLNKYYEKMVGKEIPQKLEVENIKKYIVDYQELNQYSNGITSGDLFGEQVAEEIYK